jgi:uncharacterized membrane protein YfcA
VALSEYAAHAWVLLAVAALLVGFAKTAIGGLASVSVAVFAAVLPTRESTATLLMLLLVGDVIAVWHYRRDCDVAMIRRLVPAVIPGLVIGALVLARVDDTALRRMIGAILLVLLVLQLVLSARQRPDDEPVTAWSRPATATVGVVAGFTTMVANAGGPVMTLYLLAQRVEKMRFLGTIAWFFFLVNLCKLPFSAGLGLIYGSTLRTAGVLVPFVVVGAAIGVVAVRRLQQRTFDRVVLVASALSAVPLFLT